MRHALLITLVLLLGLSASAQERTEEEKQIRAAKAAIILAKKSGQQDSVEGAFHALANLAKQQGNTFEQAHALYKLGRYQKDNYNDLPAITNLLEARKLFTGMDSLKRALSCSWWIYKIYQYEHDMEQAYSYIEEGLALAKELKDTVLICKWHNGLGNTYIGFKEYEKAIEPERITIRLANKIGNKPYLSFGYSTLGEVFYYQGNLDSALFYMHKSLELKKELRMKTAWLYSKIGKVKIKQKQFEEAIKLCSTGYKRSQGKGSLAEIFNCECLMNAYEGSGDFKNAFRYQSTYRKLKEQQESLEKFKELAIKNYSFAYEQKSIADSVKHVEADKLKDAQIGLKDEKLKSEANQKKLLYIILGIILLSVIFMVNRILVIRKQKQQISKEKETSEKLRVESDEQRTLVVEKNKEIMDSINYAKRIQGAILPSPTMVEAALPEHFILYIPKDVVAGDFYWMETVNGQTILAAADCTGHGVPGAMVSVVCHNALNRAVREFQLTQPGEILDKTRELVIEQFEKSDEDVRDGMDISMCSIAPDHLLFAGANNPLWVMRNGELIEIKGDKQAIGLSDKLAPFTTHRFDLQPGDTFYLFSDGYADQFGGAKGKKYKAKSFKALLASIEKDSMADQKNAIEQEFETWKGDLEQLDDICVIGVRV